MNRYWTTNDLKGNTKVAESGLGILKLGKTLLTNIQSFLHPNSTSQCFYFPTRSLMEYVHHEYE